MANGAFKFKDNSGNVVSFISGSDSNILFSGGTLDLSGMTGLTLGNLTLSGTTQNALSASHAASYLLTSSFNTYSGTTDTVIGTLQTSTGSLNSFSSSTNNSLSSIETSTSSLNSFTSSATNRLSSIETTTGSLNSYTSSNNTRLGVIESTTGSLNSYTSSNTTNINAIHTSTSSLNSFTSSATTRLSSIEGVSGSYATTGSNQFKNDQVITGSLIVTGFIETQELRTTYISSSILFRSGSTKFGDELDDTHAFTGSLLVSGTISVPGSNLVSGSSQVLNGSGVFSGSAQLPSGIVSGSAQTIANLPSGTVSGSVQVDVMSTTNIARLATTGSNTFTGALNGTSAVFSGQATFSLGIEAKKALFGISGVATPSLIVNDNDQSNVRLRLQNSTSGNTWDLVGGLNAANNSDFSIYDVSNNVTALRIVPVTGAATFSSSVTAKDSITVTGNYPSIQLTATSGTNFYMESSFTFNRLVFGVVGNAPLLQIASTGAATFSSSVTANSLLVERPESRNMLGISTVSLPTSGDEEGVAVIKTNSTLWQLSTVGYSVGSKGVRFYNNGGAGNTAFEVTQAGGTRFMVNGDGNVLIGTTNADVGGSVLGTVIRSNGTFAAAINMSSPPNYTSPIVADRMNTAGDGLMYGMWRQGFFQAGIGATNTQVMSFVTGDGSNSVQRERLTIAKDGVLTITGPGLIVNRPSDSSGEPFVFFNKNGVTRGSIYGGDNEAGLRFFSDKNTFSGSVSASSFSTSGFIKANGSMKTFSAAKDFAERLSNVDYFRISTAGGSGFQVVVYSVSQNVGVGWSGSQIFQAVTAPYWGGWVGHTTNVSTIGNGSPMITSAVVGNDGTITFKVSTGNNGTVTDGTILSYIQITGFNIDLISVTTL